MFNPNKLLQKVREDYNKIADHFSQTRQFSWPEFFDFKPYLKPGQRVLDLGCGNGRLYFSFLKDLNLEYHGIDNSERLIVIARSRGRDSRFTIRDSLNPNFIIGEIIKLPFQDNYFDIILCIATFHHLPSKELRQKALNEIKRVLKPGGYLLMTNWYWWQKFPWQYFFNKWWQKISWNDLFIPWKNQKGEVTDLYYHAFTKKELGKIINESGLRIEKIYLFDKEKKTKKKSRINLITIAKK